jgi:teichuronic acid biosynthesis glycosyltransferase TuaH
VVGMAEGELARDVRHLVWISGVSWDGHPGSDRLMGSAMTRYGNILWVDPPVSPLALVRRRSGEARTVKPVISVISDRIIRLTPVALPGLTRPLVRLTTAILLRAQIRWALRRTGIRPFAVVASHLENVLYGWDNGVVRVLYGTDDYVSGAGLMGLSAGRLKTLERLALARADVVIAISSQLARRWSALGANPILIPNGCSPAQGSAETLPSAVRDLKAPVIGLFGQLSERIDFDLLDAIVEAGFSLLLVGPRDPRWETQRFATLIARPNVYYAGSVALEEMPSYLAAIDVGITPYQDSPFNRASFPLKTLEYLGAGRPVVSTNLPAARWLCEDLARSDQVDFAEKILTLASSPPKFVAALVRMAGDPKCPRIPNRAPSLARLTESAGEQRRAFAERHSWPRRAEAFAAAIGLTDN